MEDTTPDPHTEPVQRIRPILGILGVLLGASLATFFGRLLSVGAPDLRGALRLDFDSASWISTSYNMGLMFIGPFSVYLGGLLGPRRVLLASAAVFSVLCLVMPFAGHLSVLIFLLVLAGMTAGTFYPSRCHSFCEIFRRATCTSALLPMRRTSSLRPIWRIRTRDG